VSAPPPTHAHADDHEPQHGALPGKERAERDSEESSIRLASATSTHPASNQTAPAPFMLNCDSPATDT
jgi:hypothetical protein